MGRKGVSVPARCRVCLGLHKATGAWHQVCSHSLTSQISESSGGSFLSWRRRAKTCSEWTLLSVRRLTSFISIRGNIKWSWGNHWNIFRNSTRWGASATCLEWFIMSNCSSFFSSSYVAHIFRLQENKNFNGFSNLVLDGLLLTQCACCDDDNQVMLTRCRALTFGLFIMI